MPSLRAFSSPWQLCPMGSTAGVARPLASQEPWPPRARSRGSVRALSRASASGRAEAPGLACVCWCSSAQTHPQAGVLPSCLAPQALTGPPLWGLCWSAAALALGEGGYGDAPRSACDSACDLASLPARLCPPRPPPHVPSGRLPLLFHSQQQTSPWGCSPIPTLQLPATAPPRPCPGPAELRQGLSMWISVHPGSQVSCCTLNGPLPPLCPKRQPHMGIRPLHQFPQALQGSARIYKPLSGGQGLLPTLSGCSARSSASGDYSWCVHKEMDSSSTYSSAVLPPSLFSSV